MDNTRLNANTTTGDLIATDDIGGTKFQRVKITLGADGVNDGDVSSSNALPIAQAGHAVDANNTTTTPLGISGVYTGTGTDVTAYASITVQIFADEASAADGLSLEWSTDGTNWDVKDQHTILANQGEQFTAPRAAQFFRVVYTNGATAQTAFRLETILNRFAVSGEIEPLDVALDDKDQALVTRAVIAGDTGSGYQNVGLTAGGNFKIALEEYDGVPVGGGTEAGALRVTLASDSTGVLSIDDGGGSITVDGAGTSMVDDAAFTIATTRVTPMAGAYISARDSLDDGDAGAVALTQLRGQYVTIESETGTAVPTGGGAQANALRVTLASDSSGQVTAVQSTAANLKGQMQIIDGTGDSAMDDANNAVRVTLASGAATHTDDAAFTVGTGIVAPMGALYDETLPDSVDEDDVGAVRMSGNRNLYMNIRDGSGNERGATVTTGLALKVDGSAVTQPISGSITVTGDQDLAQSHTRNEAFKEAAAIGGELDDTATVAATEGNISPVRITTNRAMHVNIRDDAGDSVMDNVNDAVRVNVVAGAAGGTAMADDSAFAVGLDQMTPVGGTYRAVRDLVDSNDGGAFAMTARRALLTVLEDSSGNEYGGTAAPFNVQVGDGTNQLGVDASGRIGVEIFDSGGVSTTFMDVTNTSLRVTIAESSTHAIPSYADDSSFVVGTAQVAPAGGMFDDTTPDSIDEGDVGVVRMSANRNLYSTIRDAAGNERGVNVTAGNALTVDGSAVNQPVVGAGAHGSAVTGNPVLNAGYGSATAPTAVAAGEAVRAWHLLNGAYAMSLRDDAGDSMADGANNALRVNVVAGSASGPSAVDDAAFTVGTDTVNPIGGMYDDISPDTLDEGDAGIIRATLNRALHVNLRDNSGNEYGTASQPLSVDDAGGSLTIDGSVSVTGNVTVVQGTASSLNVEAHGNTAHDATFSGNPVGIGGRASDATPTAVSADLDTVIAWFDRRGAQKVAMVDDAGDSVMDGANDAIRVNVVAGGGSGGSSHTDDSAFTVGSSTFTVAGGTYKSVRDLVDDNDAGAFAMTSRRALYTTLEDSSGNAVNVTSNALDVSADLATVAGAAVAVNAGGSGTGAQRVTIAADAHDATHSERPIGIGAYASTATPTAVTADGDATRLWASTRGSLTVSPRDMDGTSLVAEDAVTNTLKGIPALGHDGGTTNYMLRTDTAGRLTVKITDGVDTASVTANSQLNVYASGGVAQDAAILGNPLPSGGRASDATPSDMSADGDAVYAWHGREGSYVVAGSTGTTVQPLAVDSGGRASVQLYNGATAATFDEGNAAAGTQRVVIATNQILGAQTSGTLDGINDSLLVDCEGRGSVCFYLPAGLTATVECQATAQRGAGGANFMAVPLYDVTSGSTSMSLAVGGAQRIIYAAVPVGAIGMVLKVTAYTSGSITGYGDCALGGYAPPASLTSGRMHVELFDSGGDSVTDDANDAIRVNVVAGGGSGGTSMTDDAAFTPGTTAVTPMAGTYRSVRDALDDNDAGAVALTQNRGQLVTLENSAGASVSYGAGGANSTETLRVAVAGEAIDSPLLSRPVAIGGRASTSTPTSVSSDGDAQALWLSPEGSTNTILRATNGTDVAVSGGNALYTNMAQVGTNNTAVNAGAASNGTLRTVLASDQTHDVSASGSLGALNDTVALDVAGRGGAGFYVASGLTGTIEAQVTFDGTNWSQVYWYSLNNNNSRNTRALGGTNEYGYFAVPPGAQQVRVECTAYTSGSATCTIESTIAGYAPPALINGGAAWSNLRDSSGTEAMAAHDAAAASAGVQLLGYASAGAPTDVADGDAARIWVDPAGSPVIAGYTGTATVPCRVDGSGRFTVVGAAPHSSVASGAPVLMGGYASDAAPTDVTDTEAVNAWFAQNGAQVIAGYSGSVAVPLLTTAGGVLMSAGPAAHDAAAGTNPVGIGAYASSAAPTAVSASGDAARVWSNLNGALVMAGYDGSAAQTLKTDSAGYQQVQLVDASGDALADNVNANLRISGSNPHDANSAGNPVAMGLRGNSGLPTAVSANNDNVHAWANLNGAQVMAGYDGSAAQTVKTDTSGNVGVSGIAIAGAAMSGIPVAVSARANQNEPTAVDDADATYLWADQRGALVVQPQFPANLVSATHGPGYVNATASGATALVAAPGASLSIYVTGFTLSNVGGTAQEVLVQDGSTTRFGFMLAADGGGVSHKLQIPWKLAANAALNVNLATGAGDVHATAEFYVAA